jgi:Ca-activated chloride channel family protein
MRRASTAVRIVAMLCVVGAAFAPVVAIEGRGRTVVLVVDGSLSVTRDASTVAEAFVREIYEARGDTSVAVVGIYDRAEVVSPPGAELPSDFTLSRSARRPGTNLASGIRLAGALLPDSGERRIVLLTDGRETRGDARAAVARLRRRGVELDTLSLDNGVPAGPVVERLTVTPERAVMGQAVTATASVRGVPGAQAAIRWSESGHYARTDLVTFDPAGRAEVVLEVPHPTAGLYTFEAEVSATDAAHPTGRARGAAYVAGRPKVLVVSLAGERPGLLAGALDDGDAEVSYRGLEVFDDAARALTGVDLVVLSDLPIARAGEVTLLSGLTVAAQEALIEYVSQGGGLFVTGGAFGFSPEYGEAPLARLLPVEIEDRGEIDDPEVAMAVMLDRSGSMGAMVGTHTKLELAIEASLAAASTLRPDDRVAIASVDIVSTWHQPLEPTATLLQRREAIRAMSIGGGGIYVYTALADAYALLGGATEPVRHVILFSDTADSEEQFQGCPFMPCSSELPSAVTLAETARRTGVTTSVVGIGNPTDHDVAFLQELANAGGGRYYLTTQGTDLRRIFVAETRAAARSNLHEGDVRVVAGDSHPIRDGVDASAIPSVDGFVETLKRPSASTILETDDGRPILAAWRYGLGQVVGITTDGGGLWTEAWSSWQGSGQLMRQAARFAMRRHMTGSSDADVVVNEREVELVLDVAPESRSRPARVELLAIDESGNEKRLEAELEPEGPFRYRARARIDGQPFVIARAWDDEGTLVVETFGGEQSADEYAGSGADERLLRELAREGRGRFAPSPFDVLRAARASGERPLPLWPLLLVIAALLVAVDLWLRRLGRSARRDLSTIATRATPRSPELRDAA